MYSGKTVLITGTSRGVGKGLTEYFLYHGAEVIGVSRKPELSDGKFHHYTCDLSDVNDIARLFTRLSIDYRKIDILINNAAVLTSQYSTKMDVESAKDMVMVNLLGVFLVSRECAKLMKRADYGRIINISSMAVSLEPMGDSMYAACKAGVNTMSNIMAKEFSFMNVTCNTLGISAIETDMLKQLNKEKIDKVVNSLPIPRYATMDDIINVVDFLASERGSYITAQTIYLGGVH